MLNSCKHIHMIGIGGISMSAVAEYLVCKGYKVSGSDRCESEITKALSEKGVKIYIGHDAKNIEDDVDLVLYTAAIHDDNPEIIRAKELKIKLIDRAAILGTIMKDYKYSIAVAGSHGKTTVTAMISEILIDAGKDPTIFVGGILNSTKNNFRMGHTDYFVLEACEYCDSFLKFSPHVAVINNFDLDHIDYFKSIEQLRDSFRKFANNVKESGFAVINDEYKDILSNYDKKAVSFGLNKGNWTVSDIKFDEKQCAEFTATNGDVKIEKVKLNVPGRYNILNALAAISATFELGIDIESIKLGLQNFSGTKRRFEFKGFYNGAKIIDDYAHHPNELKETVVTAKKLPCNRFWCVFQSHTYSRTKAFFKEFAEILSAVDEVILVDIYAAREKNIYNVTSQDLAEEINRLGGDALYVPSFDEAVNYLKDNIAEDDLVLTVGAGDVYEVGEKLLGLREK